ncbi:penicillin-binding transpeptidase domain-containing protein [Sporolactobacillus sp. THM7-7]|nr:penicillin-binding transpeptidase domain-containing protein [Sporolactobacillus sp. THM7-7]
MKRLRSYSVCVFLILLTVTLLAGCGGQDTTPEDRFQSYVNAWKNQNFSKMYGYLSKKSQKAISKSDFIARYERIYDGIEAGKLSVHAKKTDENKEGTVPFKATLPTVAGPARFSESVHLTKETRGDKENWYIDWKPSLILPKMTGEDKVSVETLPSERGEILDRNGRPLAMNGTASRIDVIPGKLGSGDKRARTIAQIAERLGVTKQQINDALSASWVKDDSLVPIKTIDASRTDLVSEVTQLPGVVKTDVDSRVYPDKEASAHLTGYVGPITAELLKKHPNEGYNDQSEIGRTGLEQIFEKQLRRQDGAVIHIVDPTGAEKSVVAQKEPKDGQDVQLTIDRRVQDALYNELKKEAGTGVAIDPKTGDVLGLVSAPSYNPNDFVFGLSSGDYNKLSKDPKKPLLNRFTAASAPGSTFKPVTAAIALNRSAIDPGKEVPINGKKWQANKSWGDYYVTRLDSAPKVDMEKALYLSDNIYFAQTALKIGGDHFAADSKKFGFGEALPIPYPVQKSSLSRSGKLNESTLLANSGYGQGQVQVNPLHLSLIYSAFVNDGSIIKPRLVKTDAAPEFWKKQAMSKETAQLISKDLVQVIENPAGTARNARISGVTLAGKTGTPEFKNKQGGSGRENGWFVAYNTKNPKLMVTMVVENTQDRGGSHAVTSKVKNVFQKIFKP